MNFLRHNIVTLALVIVVAAVTALNSFTIQATLAQFNGRNADLFAEVACSEARRCDRMEATLNRLYRDYTAVKKATNELVEELSAAAHHIRDCHTLLERAGIKPPEAFPLQDCPADCPKCPGKIKPDSEA